MRPIDEINDPAKLLDFAKSKRLLQFSSHESLGEITSLLYKVVVLADKNMPFKVYLDVVRDMQGASRQVEVLTGLNKIEEAVKQSAEVPDKQQIIAALAKSKAIITDVRKTLPDKITTLQEFLNPFQAIQPTLQDVLTGLRPLAFEDEFILAVAFLDLEVSKLGAITYLKGESADYKETKCNRSMLDTHNENVLKNLSAGLTRPNGERGSVEMGMIDSAQKRLTKLIDLHATIPEVVRRINSNATKLDVLREVRVGYFQEKLTLTDYDILMRMARREKLISSEKRQKDPENNYELRLENHDKVKEIALRLGVTPRRALNQILDDFFALTVKQAQLGASAGKSSKPGKE